MFISNKFNKFLYIIIFILVLLPVNTNSNWFNNLTTYIKDKVTTYPKTAAALGVVSVGVGVNSLIAHSNNKELTPFEKLKAKLKETYNNHNEPTDLNYITKFGLFGLAAFATKNFVSNNYENSKKFLSDQLSNFNKLGLKDKIIKAGIGISGVVGVVTAGLLSRKVYNSINSNNTVDLMTQNSRNFNADKAYENFERSLSEEQLKSNKDLIEKIKKDYKIIGDDNLDIIAFIRNLTSAQRALIENLYITVFGYNN